jgi:hypothetical protein
VQQNLQYWPLEIKNGLNKSMFNNSPFQSTMTKKKKKKKPLNKNYKGAIAAAQTGNSHELSWSKKKKKIMMLGGPRLP